MDENSVVSAPPVFTVFTFFIQVTSGAYFRNQLPLGSREPRSTDLTSQSTLYASTTVTE